MKLRRMFDLGMVIVAGPFGLPYPLEAISCEVLGIGLGTIDQGHLQRPIAPAQSSDTAVSGIA